MFRLKLGPVYDLKDCIKSDLARFKRKNTKASPKDKSLVRKLNKDGIIIIEDFIDPAKCEKYLEAITRIAQQHNKSILLDNGAYLNYRGSDSSIADKGMLDIFNIDCIIPELGQYRNDEKMHDLIQFATGKDVYNFSINAYINKGISTTRGYHVDDLLPVTFKAFIYLTDVKDDSYGPYSYVKGSHKFSFYRYLNILLKMFNYKANFGEMPFYRKSRAVNAIGKKGTLVLSDQTGIHRGIPQEDSKERVALVINFLCADNTYESLSEHWKKILSDKLFYPAPIEKLRLAQA